MLRLVSSAFLLPTTYNGGFSAMSGCVDLLMEQSVQVLVFYSLKTVYMLCDKWREPNRLLKCKVRIGTKWKHNRRPGKLVVVTSLPPRHFLSVDPLWYLPFYFHTTCHSVWKWILLTGFSLSLYVAYIQHHNKQISTSETDELFPYFIIVCGGRGWVTRWFDRSFTGCDGILWIAV